MHSVLITLERGSKIIKRESDRNIEEKINCLAGEDGFGARCPVIPSSELDRNDLDLQFVLP